MKKEIDFSSGKRGPAFSSKGKTRITIMLDDDVLEQFRTKAQAAGTGYQTMINQALRTGLAMDKTPRNRGVVKVNLSHYGIRTGYPEVVAMSSGLWPHVDSHSHVIQTSEKLNVGRRAAGQKITDIGEIEQSSWHAVSVGNSNQVADVVEKKFFVVNTAISELRKLLLDEVLTSGGVSRRAEIPEGRPKLKPTK